MTITVRIGAINHKFQMETGQIPNRLYVGMTEYKELKEALGVDGVLDRYNGYRVHQVYDRNHLCVCYAVEE